MLLLKQYRTYLLILFLFCFTLLTHSQEAGSVFYHLTTANGLSSNRVTAMLQDRDGFYWIATQDGLNRFDGSNCKVFRTVRDDSTSISHNHCVSLLEDDNGDIWIGTVRGLNRYIKKEGRFQRYYFTHPTLSFDRVNACTGIVRDKQGYVWHFSYGARRYDVSKGIWKEFLPDSSNPASIPKGGVYWAVSDTINNGIWISGVETYIFYDITSGEFWHKKHNPKNYALFQLKSLNAPLALDSSGNLWVEDHEQTRMARFSPTTNTIQFPGYKNERGIFNIDVDDKDRLWVHYWNGGTTIYDFRKDKIEKDQLRYVHPQSALDVQSNNLYIDRAGNYWICSNKGISIYQPVSSVQYHWFNFDNKTFEGAETNLSALANQGNHILWLGTSSGVFKYNMKEKSTQKIEKIKVRNSLVRCLLVHHDSILWIGGHAELIRYDIIHDRVLQVIKLPTICWSLKEDERGNIWAVTWTAGLFQFNKEGKLLRRVYGTGDASRPGPFDRTLSMTNSRHSGIKWLGYNGGGGFSKNEWTGKLIRSYKIPSKTPNQSTSNTITCIREDEQGDLWMGTYGGGIVHFDPDSRSFINYTQSDGLKGDFVNCVLEDDSSRLWISTSNGLCVLDTRRNSIIQPDIDLSFPSNDLVPNGTMLDNGRMIFFAGKKIVEIDPVSFLRSPISTQLLISSFKVFNDEKVLPGNGDQGEFRLRYNQNFFSFEYSLLKSNPNAPVQYAYMLEGFDRDWNYVKERKTAYFTNVPAGNYVFRVKAMDRTGQWAHYSHPVFLHIIAPFWQRWWFLLAVAAVIVTALYLFYRYRIGQVKKLFGLRTKISHDLHDEVASTLSGIRLYSELAKQQLANNESLQVKKSLDLIAVNASEMKEDMSDIIWAINPANDSFGKLLQKLKVYASETCAAAGIRFQLLTDEPIPAEKLTMEQRRNIYLICKEAINNAVKYSGARNIVLKVAQLERSVHIRITDDGKGFDPEITVNGNGVLNMQMRSKEIGANLEIQSRQGVGTDIEMFVKV